MKNVTVIIFLTITSFCLGQEHNRFKKGIKSVGLEKLYFGSSDNTAGFGSRFSYNHFLSERMSFGVELDHTNSFSSIINYNSVIISPDVKYYFSSLNKRLVFYGMFEGNFGRTSYEYDGSISPDANFNTVGAKLSIGGEYFLSPRVSLYGEIGYGLKKIDDEISQGINISIGARFYMGKKTKKRQPKAFH